MCKSLSLDSLMSDVKSHPIPSSWLTWFAIKKPTSISFVQDTVHVAVKLKSRLGKPSIILPLGKFVAGVHHLRIIYTTLGKDEHGLNF